MQPQTWSTMLIFLSWLTSISSGKSSAKYLCRAAFAELRLRRYSLRDFSSFDLASSNLACFCNKRWRYKLSVIAREIQTTATCSGIIQVDRSSGCCWMFLHSHAKKWDIERKALHQRLLLETFQASSPSGSPRQRVLFSGSRSLCCSNDIMYRFSDLTLISRRLQKQRKRHQSGRCSGILLRDLFATVRKSHHHINHKKKTLVKNMWNSCISPVSNVSSALYYQDLRGFFPASKQNHLEEKRSIATVECARENSDKH